MPQVEEYPKASEEGASVGPGGGEVHDPATVHEVLQRFGARHRPSTFPRSALLPVIEALGGDVHALMGKDSLDEEGRRLLTSAIAATVDTRGTGFVDFGAFTEWWNDEKQVEPPGGAEKGGDGEEGPFPLPPPPEIDEEADAAARRTPPPGGEAMEEGTDSGAEGGPGQSDKPLPSRSAWPGFRGGTQQEEQERDDALSQALDLAVARCAAGQRGYDGDGPTVHRRLALLSSLGEDHTWNEEYQVALGRGESTYEDAIARGMEVRRACPVAALRRRT